MIILFYIVIFFTLGSLIWYSYIYGISPTPTSPKVQNSLLHLIPEDIKGTVIELGSGWGTLSIGLAICLANCQIKGFEISPVPYAISVVLQKIWNRKNLIFFRENFFEISFSEAHLIVCYLYPGAMQKLKLKFEQELKKGTFVISHTFAIPGWKPLRVERVNDLYQTPIYLYQFKEN